MHYSRSPWSILCVLYAALVLLVVDIPSTRATDPPRSSNGLSNVVQWDNYTLFLHDQRMFINSGEFHTFRLPVPELWLDIFQKMVAAGLNSASIYIHWGLTNPAPGEFAFDGWRALQPMFDAAKLAGIFIILRPGPYINAETTAGGLALWSTSLVEGDVRSNSTTWNAAYQPYVSKIIEEAKPNQVTEGGPMLLLQIDNEYSQSPSSHAEYFADIEDQYRTNGIVVPLTYNDPGERQQFVNGTGAPDLYGLDFYPNNFNCTNGSRWNPVPTNFHQYHIETDPNRPFYLPEFQGGSHDYWGGPGYDSCRARVGPDFEDVFYKNNWASNVKMHSVYMFYGGTNWGGIAYPGAYTSYDYAGAIKETRFLWEKYDEMKRQGIFVRSSPSFRKTDWIGNTNRSMGIPVVDILGKDADRAFATLLRNPDTGTGFTVVRNLDGTSRDTISFQLTIPSSHGPLTIPQHARSITLNGRQSRVILTDYTFGASGSVLYSTASVFFAGTIGDRDVLFIYGDADQGHEVAVAFSGHGSRATSPRVRYTSTHGAFTAVSVLPYALPGGKGLLTLWDSPSQLVLFADPTTAATFWAPAVRVPTEHTVRGLETFWQFGTNTTVLVGGPYLVRNASLTGEGDRVLALRGDLNASVPLTVIAPEHVRSVTWNGQPVRVKSGSARGVLEGRLEVSSKVREIRVPKLRGWKFADSLPEVKDGFDDGDWIVADHRSTNITIGPAFGDGRVLYGCDYGSCENSVLWRGHFSATGDEKGANLTINGGTAFAASVWLNDVFLKTVSDFSAAGETNSFFAFPKTALRPGKDNVLTVLQDHMGNDEGQNQKSDRGIRGFELVGGVGNFSTWKVQGKLGGYTGYPDKVRGVLNEGGLFGEREGWHLPGFPMDSSRAHFAPRELSAGLPGGRAGVGFFIATVKLDVPPGVDATFSFEYDGGTPRTGAPYRALLFVNGWKFGRRVGDVGPQARFPVPPGILDHHGSNTIAIALWVTEDTAVHPTLDLVLEGAVDGGVGPIATNNPGWTDRRGLQSRI
ncbi:glycoside hydrolase superfamily [Trametes polyzona]|nr:glycoside hydrolase superfamily [Trametes polyzona]